LRRKHERKKRTADNPERMQGVFCDRHGPPSLSPAP
jgi:hypothetical protein